MDPLKKMCTNGGSLQIGVVTLLLLPAIAFAFKDSSNNLMEKPVTTFQCYETSGKPVDLLKQVHTDVLDQFETGWKEYETAPAETTKPVIGSTQAYMNKVFKDVFDKNLEIAKTKGLEQLFEANGLDADLPSTMDWAVRNMHRDSFYEELFLRDNGKYVEQAELVFAYLQLGLDFSELSIIGKDTPSPFDPVGSKPDDTAGGLIPAHRVLMNGCTRAVVGAVLASAIFAGVTAASGGFGAAAAVGFLATKGWATFNIMAACSDDGGGGTSGSGNNE